ncbi:MAG: TlpA disulfide reductase family protein [Burkholderiales bacterium]
MKIRAKLIVLAAAAAIAAVTAAGVWQRSAHPEAQFVALAGGNFSLREMRGRVVLVNFWSTSCAPCMEEMPKLTAAWREYSPRGFEMVAVAMRDDPPNAVADYARKQALPFRVALDPDGAIARAFGHVAVIPTTYLLDRSGRIVATYVGEPDWPQFRAQVERALAGAA